jgi:hypothetical protein
VYVIWLSSNTKGIEMLKTLRSLLLMFVILLMACNSQTSISTQQPTKSTMTLTVSQAAETTLPVPPFVITPTVIPLQIHDSASADAMEIIAEIWPSMGVKIPIPTIHIWKDGYAVWVDFGTDQIVRVHKTFLSNEERIQVQTVINNSQFWDYKGPTVEIPDASLLTIWVKKAEKERSLTFRYAPEFMNMISSLQDILEMSSMKTEYFPKQGYIYISEAEFYLKDSVATYAWPDERIKYDFSKLEKGRLVDGTILSTFWEIAQQDYFWITSNGVPYNYELRIPGLTCLYNWDESKHEWQCNPFAQ